MITVLEYLVIAAAIGGVVFLLAVFVFGRGEQLAPLDPRTSPAELPDSAITADDVRKVRFSLALRGYRMSDVDWTLDRISEELDRLRGENAMLTQELSGKSEPTERAEQDHETGPIELPEMGGGPDLTEGLEPIVRPPATGAADSAQTEANEPDSAATVPAGASNSPAGGGPLARSDHP